MLFPIPHSTTTRSYVSLVDVLWMGAVRSFQDSGLTATSSFNFAQLSFFAGVVVVVALHGLVGLIINLPKHTAWLRHAWQQRHARRNGATANLSVAHVNIVSSESDLHKHTFGRKHVALQSEVAMVPSGPHHHGDIVRTDQWLHNGSTVACADEEAGEHMGTQYSDGALRSKGRAGIMGRLRGTSSIKAALLEGREDAMPSADKRTTDAACDLDDDAPG